MFDYEHPVIDFKAETINDINRFYEKNIRIITRTPVVRRDYPTYSNKSNLIGPDDSVDINLCQSGTYSVTVGSSNGYAVAIGSNAGVSLSNIGSHTHSHTIDPNSNYGIVETRLYYKNGQEWRNLYRLNQALDRNVRESVGVYSYIISSMYDEVLHYFKANYETHFESKSSDQTLSNLINFYEKNNTINDYPENYKKYSETIPKTLDVIFTLPNFNPKENYFFGYVSVYFHENKVFTEEIDLTNYEFFKAPTLKNYIIFKENVMIDVIDSWSKVDNIANIRHIFTNENNFETLANQWRI